MLAQPFQGMHRHHRPRSLCCSTTDVAQCSGVLPCHGCSRRGRNCVFPRNAPADISLGNGTYGTNRDARLVSSLAVLNVSLSSEEHQLPGIFFDHFMPRNSFTGRSSLWRRQLQRNLSTSASLSKALVALGAIRAAAIDTRRKGHFERVAFQAYEESAAALRTSICEVTEENGPSILSTAFLLGLFELIHDPTGSGWIKHTMSGTSKLLEVLGSEACRSGDLRCFFFETRMFEIGRAVLFSERCFLAAPAWLALNEMRSTGESGRFEDAVMEIMIRCSCLCSRYTNWNDLRPFVCHG